MIRGMTGQASCRFSTDFFDAEMEIRSVNSRYFEFRIKTPVRYASLEIEARKMVSKKLERGKIDLNLRINEKERGFQKSLINKTLAQAYLNEFRDVAESLSISPELTLRDLIYLPQVMNNDIGDIDESLYKIILEELNELLDQMLPMMLAEGKSTINDISLSLKSMIKSLSFIKEKYPIVLDKYKESLKERVFEISSEKPSKERLALEIELFASRTAINEEIVRLDSHIMIMEAIISEERNETSKELDFIAQEMNREVNTIASKSNDFEITQHTIILKSEIEKMREQFRNIV